ncbi:hypothetical protein [Rhodoplanes serenus]|uniref:hypothetical protein n=1 Tax=Rhodoplanes serenus TaxID=200615 RepID=UPI000DAB4DB5|nr:hypothetical protein [Rhodoplanes serenus]RAI30577.1 hypothetical protein CH340_21175 [Rhodoplanes serenus]
MAALRLGGPKNRAKHFDGLAEHANGIRRRAQFDRDRISVAARDWADPMIDLISSRSQAVHLG